MDIYLFKPRDPFAFRSAFEGAVRLTRKGKVDWAAPDHGQIKSQRGHTTGWLSINGDVCAIMVDAPCANVMEAVARDLKCPELVVLFQEKCIWECTLYVELEPIVNFSTAPSIWGSVDQTAYFGTAQELAEVWGVPVDQIERYMVDWGVTEKWIEELQVLSPAFLLDGQKAYTGDEFEYGQLYQGFDFIRALGGDLQNVAEFSVYLP